MPSVGSVVSCVGPPGKQGRPANADPVSAHPVPVAASGKIDEPRQAGQTAAGRGAFSRRWRGELGGAALQQRIGEKCRLAGSPGYDGAGWRAGGCIMELMVKTRSMCYVDIELLRPKVDPQFAPSFSGLGTVGQTEAIDESERNGVSLRSSSAIRPGTSAQSRRPAELAAQASTKCGAHPAALGVPARGCIDVRGGRLELITPANRWCPAAAWATSPSRDSGLLGQRRGSGQRAAAALRGYLEANAAALRIDLAEVAVAESRCTRTAGGADLPAPRGRRRPGARQLSERGDQPGQPGPLRHQEVGRHRRLPGAATVARSGAGSGAVARGAVHDHRLLGQDRADPRADGLGAGAEPGPLGRGYAYRLAWAVRPASTASAATGKRWSTPTRAS